MDDMAINELEAHEMKRSWSKLLDGLSKDTNNLSQYNMCRAQDS